MKHCPACNSTFAETAAETFCPKDGTRLMIAAASYDPQATMMASPQMYGGGSGDLPAADAFPANTGGYQQPPQTPPNQSWGQNQAQSNQAWGSNQPPMNPSWGAPPAMPQYTAAPRAKSGANTKILIAVVAGVLLLGGGGLLFYMLSSSGPSAKMNPYKGSLEDFAPKDVKRIYTLVDVNKLGDRDKQDFGGVQEAIGAAYRSEMSSLPEQYKIKMFIGKYLTMQEAQDGLMKFKEKARSKDWTITDDAPKKIGRTNVGLRFVAHRNPASTKTNEGYLPDGAKIVHAQSASPTPRKQAQMLGWTNGSVLFVVIGEEENALHFEGNYDQAIENVTK